MCCEYIWNHKEQFAVLKTLHKRWFSSLISLTRLAHYDDVIMTMLASQIISLTVVYSIVYSGVNQRKHQSSASLAFVREIHRGPVNFPHKWPVTRKMFPFDDVIMMWVGSWRYGCPVAWFCYQLIAKPGNQTAITPWPDPYQLVKLRMDAILFHKYQMPQTTAHSAFHKLSTRLTLFCVLLLSDADLPLCYRVTSLQLVHPCDCPTVSETILKNYDDLCDRSRYQGQGHAITSHRYCWM